MAELLQNGNVICDTCVNTDGTPYIVSSLSEIKDLTEWDVLPVAAQQRAMVTGETPAQITEVIQQYGYGVLKGVKI